MGHVPVMSAVIVDYRPEHAAAWARLNAAWLAEGGFEIEAKDRLAIDDPQGSFLDRGGRIFIVEQNGEAVGCCALVPIADGAEVCKMTVTPAARGQGLARRLLEACEAAAREAGVQRLYLETNSGLRTAIGLYERFGFVHLPARPTPYARADVFMEMRL
jgi:putative acetyltransferase